jgi:hypothetical protein
VVGLEEEGWVDVAEDVFVCFEDFLEFDVDKVIE